MPFVGIFEPMHVVLISIGNGAVRVIMRYVERLEVYLIRTGCSKNRPGIYFSRVSKSIYLPQ